MAQAGKSSLLIIFLTVFIDLIGFGIVIPVLPKFALEFGADPLTVGLLVMSYSLAQFLLTPFWGRLSDSIGRRPVLLVSLAASTAGYLIWGFAASLPLLFLSRLVAGAGNANIAVAQAYITDVTSPEKRAKGMGLIGAAFGLGFTLGPAIGGFASQWGLSAIGFVAASFSFLAFILCLSCLTEPAKRSQAGHERFSVSPGFYFSTILDPRLRAPLAIFFLSTFAFANMEATLALLATKWYAFTDADISWLFTFVGFVMVMVQGGLIGRLSAAFNEKTLIVSGALLIAAGLFMTVVLHSVWGLYLSMAALAVGTSLNNPSNQSLVSKVADPATVGGVLGVGQSLSTLGRILGPVVGGAAFQYLGVESPYVIGGAVMAVVVLLALNLPAPGKTGSAKETAMAGRQA